VHIRESQRAAQENYRAGIVQKMDEVYSAKLKDKSDNVDALFMLGVRSARSGNFDLAVKYFREAINIDPAHIGTHYNLGNVYRDKGQIEEAFSCYQKVLQLDPSYVDAYVNMGIIFRMKRRLSEEMMCYRKAIQLNPASAEAFFNLGHHFFEKGQFDKALVCYEKVTQLKPDFVNACMNLGLVLRIEDRNEEALSCYQKAIHLNPGDAGAHWNLSNVLLLIGAYEEGWKEFEWFRKTDDCARRQRSFSQPLWDGSDIRGRTILLHAEEGFGDTIQFIRYAPLVAERGAKVIVESQEELTSLLRNIKGVWHVLSRGGDLPHFDFHCPLMSLPRIFKTTLDNIPVNIPYLFADRMLIQEFHDKIRNDGAELRVGLVWSGGGLPFKKSCSIEIFSPLADLPGITFYSLQKGAPAEQAKNPPKGMMLTDYTNEFSDFSVTAAFIENLDLIITVDTAIAHLAGALGKPVWVLLPFVPDWRWMLKREDSPWYPTMRLFRQPSLGDWKSAINKLVCELEEFKKEKA
jgi:Tfp pilus assembly protein PilF